MLAEFVDTQMDLIEENQYLELRTDVIRAYPTYGVADEKCPYAIIHKATKMVICRFVELDTARYFMSLVWDSIIFGFQSLSEYNAKITQDFLRSLPMAKDIIVVGVNDANSWQDRLGFFDEKGRFLRNTFGTPISFGWTADRLLKGMKTVTRRTWKAKYAQMFINAYQQGKLIQAFDKDRRYGGKLIGYLKVSDIYQESIFDMPESDVSAEGYPELSKEEFIGKFFSDIEGSDNHVVWVIRFEFFLLIGGDECD
jgi:hypothetical protein